LEPDHAVALRRWGIAWVCLALALALHVTDEALTGFLPVYNNSVEQLRALYAWIPLPTFTFPFWLGGLILAVLLLLGLAPLVFAGRNWLRPVSLVLAVIMVGNAFGHIAATVYWGRLAPGVYSSPVLLAAALALLYTARRARPEQMRRGARHHKPA